MRFLVLAFALLFSASLAAAPVPKAETVPGLKDVTSIPGVEVFYMERAHGLDGWFAVMPNNTVQVFYTTEDGRAALSGGLFVDGKNLTGEQIMRLREREPKVAAIFDGMMKAAENAQVAGTSAENMTPGEQLMAELTRQAWFATGSPTAPVLYLIVDPKCRYCKETWRWLRGAVGKGEVQVRIMPLGILGEESERMAGVLLEQANPGEAFDKLVMTEDSKVLDGTPKAEQLDRVKANRVFFDRWKLTQTPFLAYRGKDGKVKVVTAMPKDYDTLLADIGP